MSPPDEPSAKGFITYLYEQLQFELKNLGQPRPTLWVDKKIKQSDQFEPLLNQNLAASSHLLVIFSRNWMDREWCRKELEIFAEKCRISAEENIRDRIIVVALHEFPREKYPALLQGQDGFHFFSFSPESERAAGMEEPFFARGKIVNPDYKDLVKKLAQDLWIKTAGEVVDPPAADDEENTPPAAPDSARTVFLAKPAGDMEQAYLRLVEELQGRNISVAPSPKERIPADSTAMAYVVAELAKAEVSIHLLGEKSGYTPEDTDDPIAELQIRQAAVREATQTAEQRARTNAFRRLIWAPNVLESSVGEQRVKERDPLHVVDRFDRQLPSDKIDSDSISKFVDFVVQYLERTLPMPDAVPPIQSNSRVYLHHRPEDVIYAVQLAEVLQAANIEAVMPAFEGEASELLALHQQNLKDCDTIVLCWALAAEVWVKASSRELREWQKLGRNSRFACRGLIAGPPPGERKTVMVKVPPRNEIDIILDLTAIEQPTLASLGRLVDVAGVGK